MRWPRSDSSLRAFVLAALCFSLTGGLVSRESPFKRRQEDLQPTRKIGYFTYLNEDGSVALLVDVELARMRKTEKFIPLGIKLANKGIHALKVDRQSFRLIDAAGESYSIPGFKEVEAAYKNYSLDAKYYARKLFTEGDLLTSFASFRKLPCSFFPHPYKDSVLQDILIDKVEIPQGSFIEDLIYFPRPKSAAPGQGLWLEVVGPEFEVPFRVAFVVD